MKSLTLAAISGLVLLGGAPVTTGADEPDDSGSCILCWPVPTDRPG